MSTKTIFIVTCGVLFQDEHQEVSESVPSVEIFDTEKKAISYIKEMFEESECSFTKQGDIYFEANGSYDPDGDDSEDEDSDNYFEPSFCYRIWKKKVKV